MFRGKRTDNAEWVYGNFVEKTRWDLHKDYFITWNKLTKNPNDSLTDSEYIEVQVDPDTVVQFTGLYDKNGREIYEGDIVKIYYHGQNKVFGYVKYNMCRFYIQDDDSLAPKVPMDVMASKYDLEVISNIYDSPELLKQDVKDAKDNV